MMIAGQGSFMVVLYGSGFPKVGLFLLSICQQFASGYRLFSESPFANSFLAIEKIRGDLIGLCESGHCVVGWVHVAFIAW
jgi:hypothetical protein